MNKPDQPRAQVIRRRVREPVVIQLHERPHAVRAPHVRKHAKTFALALALLVLLGGALLTTPWVTESGESTPPVDAL
ncbi:MAG: hypothetical protein IT336_05635, partial [Thermomicrobiales bacterium]|nr:hypothetical protein [Thermomicrobiales bacterium]